MRLKLTLEEAMLIVDILGSVKLPSMTDVETATLTSATSSLKTSIIADIDNTERNINKVIDTLDKGGYSDVRTALLDVKSKVNTQKATKKSKYTGR
tara:strand:+ start:878 stop:1165 length:288 start_codon:yes stop_codon:yes gene_type:complete